MSLEFIAIIAVVFIFVLVAGIEIQHLVNTLFGIRLSTFLRTTIILIAVIIVDFIFLGVGFLLSVSLFKLLAILASYIVGAVLYKKYFQTGFWKAVLVLFIGNLVSLVLLIIVVLLLRGLLAEPFLIEGNSMAPAYPSGEYLVIEKYDRSAQRGDVVIASVRSEQGDIEDVIARVTGMSGDVVNGIEIPPGELYLSKDNPTSTSTYTISKSTVLGKPVLDLGHIN